MSSLSALEAALSSRATSVAFSSKAWLANSSFASGPWVSWKQASSPGGSSSSLATSSSGWTTFSLSWSESESMISVTCGSFGRTVSSSSFFLASTSFSFMGTWLLSNSRISASTCLFSAASRRSCTSWSSLIFFKPLSIRLRRWYSSRKASSASSSTDLRLPPGTPAPVSPSSTWLLAISTWLSAMSPSPTSISTWLSAMSPSPTSISTWLSAMSPWPPSISIWLSATSFTSSIISTSSSSSSSSSSHSSLSSGSFSSDGGSFMASPPNTSSNPSSPHW